MAKSRNKYLSGKYPMLQWFARKAARSFNRWLPHIRTVDRKYHYLRFYARHGRRPIIDGGGFNDAYFFLKTSGALDDPLRVLVTDKELAKIYIAARVGAEFVVPTLAVLRSPEALRAYAFPRNCVIKATHLSGAAILRWSGAPVDRSEIQEWFKRSHYRSTRERNYLTLRPKVIVEEFAFGVQHSHEYKIHCWNGAPKLIQYQNRSGAAPTARFYTSDWAFLPFSDHYQLAQPIEPPASLPKMLELARKLSSDFSLIRVDLYTDGTRVVVGELTNVDGGADDYIQPLEGEKKLGDVLFGSAALPSSRLK
jgi:hypothetical protein